MDEDGGKKNGRERGRWIRTVEREGMLWNRTKERKNKLS